ncbi:MAG TPA: extracellular solute-binding protein [Firmicutes bacterium]|nr:extracellular solute-binding protein [Bacillota bacterium]
MKRLTISVTSLLVLVLLISVAVSAQPQTEFTIWTKEGEVTGGVLEEIENLAQEFSRTRPGLTIEVVSYGVEELRQDFQAAAFAGQGPDLLWTVSDHAGPFVAMEIIKPVDDVFEAEFLAGFVRPGLESVELSGQTWGVPISVGNHLMLLYNKNLLPEAPQNTDEMIKVGQELTIDFDNDGMPDQYGLVYNLTEPFFFAPWLGGFGGWPLDGVTPTLNTPAMVEALRFVQDLKFSHKIVPVECDYDAADALFKEGKAAMLINGDWSLADYLAPEVAEKVDLGIARIPLVSETGLWPAPMTSGIYFMLPDYIDGEKEAIAKEFIEFISTDEVQILFLEKHMRLPATEAALEHPSLTADPILKGSADQMTVGKPMPTVPEMRAAWDAIRPNLEAIMAGKMTPEAAAQAMQEAAEKLIREMYK